MIQTNDCTELEGNDACRLEGTECTGFDESGECTMLTRRYVCEEGSKTLSLGEACDDTVCVAGHC